MIPTSFEESNHVLDKPPGMTYNECQALSVWRGFDEGNQPVVISCWKVTQEELEEIQQTGRVWLRISGQTMPPTLLQGTNPFRPVSDLFDGQSNEP
jgi:hypothetical protein